MAISKVLPLALALFFCPPPCPHLSFWVPIFMHLSSTVGDSAPFYEVVYLGISSAKIAEGPQQSLDRWINKLQIKSVRLLSPSGMFPATVFMASGYDIVLESLTMSWVKDRLTCCPTVRHKAELNTKALESTISWSLYGVDYGQNSHISPLVHRESDRHQKAVQLIRLRLLTQKELLLIQH